MQDILMNDEVKLDNSFKLSFMTDVAKGMEFLHKSHLHSHGNLKSSNCLVDARWTVRVSTVFLSVSTSLFVIRRINFINQLIFSLGPISITLSRTLNAMHSCSCACIVIIVITLLLLLLLQLLSEYFVVVWQVTDYGLPSFLSGQNFDESEHDTFRRQSLYVYMFVYLYLCWFHQQLIAPFISLSCRKQHRRM